MSASPGAPGARPRAGGAREDDRAPAFGPRVAVLERRGKFTVAEPFFAPGPRLAVSRDGRAGVGDLVLVRLDGGRGRGGGGRRARIVRRLGRPDVARDVIEALMLDRGLRRTFDPAVAHEAREAAATRGAHDPAGAPAGPPRRDLRELPTFTIDPATARDFDDAISARAQEDGSVRVWVHIADVSAFVAPKSMVDREAYRRGTSVYVPGAVEPMLPEALSNRACSLMPGQDRAAVTVEMVLSGDRVRSSAFHRSIIRSDERLDYDRVDRIFAGGERAGESWGPSLAAARAAAAALAARRAAEAALTLESAEPEFRFDREGHVVAVAPVAQTESHRLIEHLMIAANEQVAEFLERRGIPALYRVHERPDGAAVERLVEQLASLGVPTPPTPRGHITPQQAAELVGEASQLLERWVASHAGRGRRALTSLVLRSLKQAYYDPRNLGHAGLQSPRYCHFTSPIRRYPDLICHRALLSGLDGGLPAPDAAWVASAGPWTSAREREAMAIERDADDIARCFFLERRMFETGYDAVFDGEVVGLAKAGAFVAFGERGEFEGLLPVRRLRGDWWELSEQGTMLVGSRSGSTIRLGDPVAVRVGQIDAPRGRVDLLPVQGEDVDG
ncbi:MAG TPA: RNB domain-containing ribonuclease [Solirubrobacteraceae bacterium]|nr:RNB domain-containing ribonuclease [Solirubrobacteraceae bacterium]